MQLKIVSGFPVRRAPWIIIRVFSILYQMHLIR